MLHKIGTYGVCMYVPNIVVVVPSTRIEGRIVHILPVQYIRQQANNGRDAKKWKRSMKGEEEKGGEGDLGQLARAIDKKEKKKGKERASMRYYYMGVGIIRIAMFASSLPIISRKQTSVSRISKYVAIASKRRQFFCHLLSRYYGRYKEEGGEEEEEDRTSDIVLYNNKEYRS